MSAAPRAVTTIQAHNFSVSYDARFSLHTNHMAVSGNVIAVLGHNGAGKSTFLKAILGLIPTSAGKVEVYREDEGARVLLQPDQHMAFCPEVGSVFADISVESYIKLWCRLKHGSGTYYRTHAGRKYLDLLAIEPLLPKLGRELSKGQRRRVQTAIGFLTNPQLFLFDEPFDGLDIQRSTELAEIMEGESARTSLVLSSHRMDIVERLADTLIVLKDGEFVASGDLESVCETLGGDTFVIEGLTTPEDETELLRRQLPGALINQIGHRIEVTGLGLSQQKVETALRSVRVAGVNERVMHQPVDLTRIRPTLVDAMNYHLKSSRSREDPGPT